MEYLASPGEPAFTPSGLEKIKNAINQHEVPSVLEVRALWVHYTHCINPGAVVEERLSQILPGPSTQILNDSSYSSLFVALEGKQPVLNNSRIFYVTPRNISPWSSKATSIAHVCGLKDHIDRVERGRMILVKFAEPFEAENIPFKDALYDRMTETISTASPVMTEMFAEGLPHPLEIVDIFAEGTTPMKVLKMYDRQLGLSLDQSEMEYLVQAYKQLGRAPFDIELFMFAQVNSEHCRHKQFNANWTIDNVAKTKSLFGMIRNTYDKNSKKYIVSAYSDNAAVLEGVPATFWAPDYSTGSWKATKETVHYLIKVETHNHPTAISPFPGAATGSGGEIRDEGAVGRGSTPKAGLCGFWVSDLLIPGHKQSWEIDLGRPAHFASSLDIMLEAPIGSARFNNEFGRPCLTGCFRTLLTEVDIDDKESEVRGYHKPIMIAGGVGTVRPQHALKTQDVAREGAHVIVLGGPAMLIGLGGGAASSNASAEESAELDFASVQRGNPEMERRAQMVINACTALGPLNPIAMIHDVGAGGLSNALPELVKDAGFGGNFELRQIECVDRSLSPLQIWCCEAQERYVLLVNEEGLNKFTSIANRERCGFSNVGRAVRGKDEKLVLTDRDSPENPVPIDMPMSTLFPESRKLERIVQSRNLKLSPLDFSVLSKSSTISEAVATAVKKVFSVPAVGSKSFLITIGDRTVGGMTTRDQMVGPWQIPVADVAVTATALQAGIKTGEAQCMGEKPNIALISAAASARMAVAESLMNIAAADVLDGLGRIQLSANWMAAVNHPGEGAALYEAVHAIGMELCPELGIVIPVGKDSYDSPEQRFPTSMSASWTDPISGEAKKVTSPMTVVISAFAPVANIRKTWTPALRRFEDVGETVLLFVDLAEGRKALGGSALAQAHQQLGDEAPDVRSVDLIKDYYDAIWQLHQDGIVLAYHDRSDGGLVTTIAEMMFAGRCGAQLMIDNIVASRSLNDILETLFNEELGAVFQVRKSDEINFSRCFATCGPPKGLITKIGVVPTSSKQTLSIRYGQDVILSLERSQLQQWWSSTSHQVQRLRDNTACADEEFSGISDDQDPGLSYKLKFDPKESVLPLAASLTSGFKKVPRVAILREQGVNGHAEMAFAFKAAGFDPVDIHMTDIIGGKTLAEFVGIAACGGFSYGDVLGAGQGWAKSVLLNAGARREFKLFFERTDTFTLGVCNGCQFLSHLQELIPGTAHWPTFADNLSEQFEARLCMVKIEDKNKTPSVFFHGMNGSELPIVVSHGEGRASFNDPSHIHELNSNKLIPIRYIDNRGAVTTKYPFNPNGSPEGIAGVRSLDGRVLAMMPHPERTILSDAISYAPAKMVAEWGEFGPWVRMFRSARRWVG